MIYNAKKIREEIAAGKEVIRYRDYALYNDELCPSECCKSDSSENRMSLFEMLEETNIFSIDEKILERNGDKINWDILYELPHFPKKFSQNFLDKFVHDINWNRLIMCKSLSIEFILKNKNNFNWNSDQDIKYIKVTEEQLRELEPLTNDITNFVNSSFEHISEEFILEFKHKISMNHYVHMSKRSISFIKRFKENVFWDDFIKNTVLTEEHLEEFHDLIDWREISSYYYISDRLMNKYATSIAKSQMKQMKRALEYYEEEQLKCQSYNEGEGRLHPQVEIEQPMAIANLA